MGGGGLGVKKCGGGRLGVTNVVSGRYKKTMCEVGDWGMKCGKCD